MNFDSITVLNGFDEAEQIQRTAQAFERVPLDERQSSDGVTGRTADDDALQKVYDPVVRLHVHVGEVNRHSGRSDDLVR